MLTTLHTESNCVISHGISAELLACQAAAIDVPLHQVFLPSPCPNEIYERIMAEACAQLVNDYHISHIAFGDLYFKDVRAYREKNLQRTGIIPLFPLWGSNTAMLAREMIDSDLKARVSCVDTKRLPAYLAGKEFAHAFLDALPSHIDLCGENGEFHTFVTDAPSFFIAIPVSVNVIEGKDRFALAVLILIDIV